MKDRSHLIRTFNQKSNAISSPGQRNIKMIVLNFRLFPKTGCLHNGQWRPSGYKFTATVNKLTQRPLCIHQNCKILRHKLCVYTIFIQLHCFP